MGRIIAAYFSPLRVRAVWVAAVAVAVVLTVAERARPAEPPAYVVTNKMPQFVVVNKTKPTSCPCGSSCPCPAGGCPGSCPVVVPATPTDPRGVWSPVWDGRQWHARWVQEVSQTRANPFPPSGSTAGIPVPFRGAGGLSTSYPDVAPFRGVTYTLAPQGIPGGTSTSNCPPAG